MQRLRRDVRAAGAAFLTERKCRLKPVFRRHFFQTALESQTLFAMPYIPNPIRYKLKTTIQKTEIHIIKQTNKLTYCAISKAVSYFPIGPSPFFI